MAQKNEMEKKASSLQCTWHFGGASEALAPFLSGGVMGMWQWDCGENSVEHGYLSV